MTSRTPYNSHHEVVINRAKFDVCAPGSFGGVETDRSALYILYFLCIYRLLRAKRTKWHVVDKQFIMSVVTDTDELHN